MTRFDGRSMVVASLAIALLAALAIQPAAAGDCTDGGNHFDSPSGSDCESAEVGGGVSAVDAAEYTNTIVNAGRGAGVGGAAPPTGGGSVPQLKADHSDPEGY